MKKWYFHNYSTFLRSGINILNSFQTQNSKCASNFTKSLTRAVMKLEPEVDDKLNPDVVRRHPGITTIKTVTVKELWEDAALQVFNDGDYHVYREEAEKLYNYLYRRKAPVEEHVIKQKALEFEKQCFEEGKLNRKNYKSAEELSLDVKSYVTKKLGTDIYNWQPINFTEDKSLCYLIGRSTANYAVLLQIFNEIKKRLPEFEPKTILDFGSGTGTVLWAAYDHWQSIVEEYYAVDISADMNEIARKIAHQGNSPTPSLIKSTFYRQFLPATHNLSYDLVVSAFSLMELPNVRTRLQTLENLWLKTSELLVVVEQGTNAGYELVAEARDFLLKTSEAEIYVFAPCSNDGACPRWVDKTPCNFKVQYFNMFNKQQNYAKTELYSYVVLRKRRRNEDGGEQDSWPRIVRPILTRGGHVICRVCCSDAQLKEVIVTKAKQGKTFYKCARISRWGDLLPAVIDHEGELKSQEKKQQRQQRHQEILEKEAQKIKESENDEQQSS